MKPAKLRNATINDNGTLSVTVTVMGESPKEVVFLGFCVAIIQTVADPVAAMAAMAAQAKSLNLPFPA